MPRWWVLSALLAGSSTAAAAAKIPPMPAAHRPAFILSQKTLEQPPKLAATDAAPAAVKVGRLRGGDSPDAEWHKSFRWLVARTAVYYLLRTTLTGHHHLSGTLPTYLKLMHCIIVHDWLCFVIKQEAAARLVLITAVYYLLRTNSIHRWAPPPVHHLYDTLPTYLKVMHFIIVCGWFWGP